MNSSQYTAGRIGVIRDGSTFRVAMWNGIALADNGWKPSDAGSQVASVALPSSGSGGHIWLRTSVNVLLSTQKGTFQYSTDGKAFASLGYAATIENTKVFLMGWRYGVFNFAMKALGGAVTLREFTIDGTQMNSAA